MENLLIKVETREGKLVVSSRTIAEQLGKRHDNVVRDLEKILETSNVSSLIIPSTYKVIGQNREYKEYLLTKDGFTLYMFNIQGYQEFKLAYINKFNEMEKQLLNNINSKQNLLLSIIQAPSEVERAVALNKYELEYVKPLEENLEKTTKKLEHKQEVIDTMVEDIKLKTQRQFLVEIIKMKPKHIKERWTMLYKAYEHNKHINLNARYEGYNLINSPKLKSKLEYIDKVANDIPFLYGLAVKMFESDFKDKLKKYMSAL